MCFHSSVTNVFHKVTLPWSNDITTATTIFYLFFIPHCQSLSSNISTAIFTELFAYWLFIPECFLLFQDSNMMSSMGSGEVQFSISINSLSSSCPSGRCIVIFHACMLCIDHLLTKARKILPLEGFTSTSHLNFKVNCQDITAACE